MCLQNRTSNSSNVAADNNYILTTELRSWRPQKTRAVALPPGLGDPGEVASWRDAGRQRPEGRPRSHRTPGGVGSEMGFRRAKRDQLDPAFPLWKIQQRIDRAFQPLKRPRGGPS